MAQPSVWDCYTTERPGHLRVRRAHDRSVATTQALGAIAALRADHDRTMQHLAHLTRPGVRLGIESDTTSGGLGGRVLHSDNQGRQGNVIDATN